MFTDPLLRLLLKILVNSLDRWHFILDKEEDASHFISEADKMTAVPGRYHLVSLAN